MDAISLIIGLLVGGAVGLAVTTFIRRKDSQAHQARITAYDDELARLQQDAHTRIAALEAHRNEREEALNSAQRGLASATAQVERMQTESIQLAAALKESEAARARTAEQATAHQLARRQAEGRARQAQAHATEAIHQNQELALRLEELQTQSSELQKTAERRAQQIARLQDLAANSGSQPTGGAKEASAAFAQSAGSLDGVLQVLVDQEHQQAAVLSDNAGIIVSAVGDKELSEGIAATAQLLSHFGQQLQGVVPFCAVKAFRLQDAEAAVIAGRTFESAGSQLALATYGPKVPQDEVLDGAMTNLKAALE